MVNRKFIFILSLFICFLLTLPSVSANPDINNFNDTVNLTDNINNLNDNVNLTDDFNIYTNESYEYHFNVNVTVEDLEKEKTYICSNYPFENNSYNYSLFENSYYNYSATKFIGIKNKELLLQFIVYDENNDLVKNGTKVAVYVFSKEYNSTIINGKATIPITINSTGDFAFELRYYGNEFYENCRNFTYISIYDEEYESEINNEIVLNYDLDYDNSTDNISSNINQNEDYNIITFDNYLSQGTKKNLSFKIPKIIGKVNQSIEIPIQASLDDESVPNLSLTINFNNRKEIVSIVNGSGKLNLILPNNKGIYNLSFSFNSTDKNNSSQNSSSNSSEIESEIAENSYFDDEYYGYDNKNRNSERYINNSINNPFKNTINKNYINMSKTSNPIFLLIISLLFLVISRKKQ